MSITITNLDTPSITNLDTPSISTTDSTVEPVKPFSMESQEGANVNPMIAEMVRPAMEAEEAFQQSVYDVKVANRKTTDEILLGYDKWQSGVDPEVKDRRLIRGVMKTEFESNPESLSMYETKRSIISKELFGEEINDDKVFVKKLTERAEIKRDKDSYRKDFAEKAILKTLTMGKFADAMGEMSGHAGMDHVKDYESREIFDRVKEGIESKLSSKGVEMLSGVFDGFEAQDREGFMEDTREMWKVLDKDQRDYAARTLGFMAKKMPKKERDEFFEYLGESMRGVASTGRMLGNFKDRLDAANMERDESIHAQEIIDRKKIVASELEKGRIDDERAKEKYAEIDKLEEKLRKEDDRNRPERDQKVDKVLENDFVELVISSYENDYDPTDFYLEKDTVLGSIERGAHAAPGALSTTAVAVIPYVGIVATTGIMFEQSKADLNKSLFDQGMNIQDATKLTNGYAALTALPNMILEKLGGKALTGGKVNPLGWAEKKILSRVTSNFATKAAIRMGAETSTELAQDLWENTVKDFAAGMDERFPDIKWTGEGGVFDGYAYKVIETAVAVAPMAGISAGFVKSEEISGIVEQMDDLVIEAAGYDIEKAEALRKAKGTFGEAAAAEAFRDSHNPNSEKAKVASEKLQSKVTEHHDAIETAASMGVLPSIKMNEEGKVEVYDEYEGELIGTADNNIEAQPIIESYLKEQDVNAEQFTDYVMTMLGSAEEHRKESRAKGYSERYNLRLGEGFTVDEAIKTMPEHAGRLLEESELYEKAHGGDGKISLAVNGYSQTEFDADQRIVTNTLFKGSSPLTVIHESTHGAFRRALDQGALTKEETIQFFRMADGQIGDKGQKFLKSSEDGDVTFTELDEAVSEWMESEVLRTRKGVASTFTSVLREGLKDAATNDADVKVINKFKAFAKAVGASFKVALTRAAYMNRAIKNGLIKEADIDDFRAKLQGTSIQEEFNKEVDSEYKNITDEQLQKVQEFVPSEDVPFSISPAQDAEYMSAVESGDMDKAQEMVDQAAKDAGYDSPKVYHGTSKDFNEFSKETIGRVFKFDDEGFFFTNSIEQAKKYASHSKNQTGGSERLISAFLKLDNPFTYKDHAYAFMDHEDPIIGMDDQLLISWADRYREDHIEDAKDYGMDGLFYERGNEVLAAVFNPNQIKSADPVTKDSEGNVIPLSERFNENKDSISYSISPAQDAETLVDEFYDEFKSFSEYSKKWDEEGVDEFGENNHSILDNLDDSRFDFHDKIEEVFSEYLENHELEIELITLGSSAYWEIRPNDDLAEWWEENNPDTGIEEDVVKIRVSDHSNTSRAHALPSGNIILGMSKKKVTSEIHDILQEAQKFDKKNAQSSDAIFISSKQPSEKGGSVIDQMGNLASSSSESTSFSVSPAQDAEYMRAVESGDVETQQAMVDQAAEKKGYNLETYHGTTSGEFETIDLNLVGRNGRSEGVGFYSTPDKGEAEIYTREKGRIMNVRLRKEKYIPASYVPNERQVSEIMSEYVIIEDKANDEMAIEDIREDVSYYEYMDESIVDMQGDLFAAGASRDSLNEAISKVIEVDGFKSVGYDNEARSDLEVYVTLNDGKIKSNDPVTYDSDGKVIPLSERFNEHKDSISFSLGRSPMEYNRVMPRDLFNEAKVLSMHKKLIDDFNSGKLPEGFQIKVHEEGFNVGQNSEDGGLFLDGVDVMFNGEYVTFTVPYNSGKTDRFPLIATAEEIDVWGVPVFDSEGNLDEEFTEAFEGDLSSPDSYVDIQGEWEMARDFMNLLGGIGLAHVDGKLSENFEFELADGQLGFEIEDQGSSYVSNNLDVTMNGDKVDFSMDYNGVLSYDHNGKDGKVYESPRVFSKEFKDDFFSNPSISYSILPIDEFIQGSKVVDSKGEAKKVFHGSPDIRNILSEGFKKSITRGDIYFFSDDYSVANTYADDSRAIDYQNAEPHVITVYLNIKNPMVIDAKGAKWRDTEKHIAEAKDKGHDGVIIKNSRDEYNNTDQGGKASTVYAVFKPSQIKSAQESSMRSRIDGINLGIPKTFSISETNIANELIKNATGRTRSPEARIRIMGDIATRVEDLKRDKDKLKRAFGKDYTEKAHPDKRTKKSLKKESAMIEALKREELEEKVRADHYILEAEELTKLKEQPIHEYLSSPSSPLKGQLMSVSSAMKSGKYDIAKDGDYDGAGGVSKTLFGGTLMPDQAAQELFDQGLIKDPYADTMWQALESEQISVTARKEDLKNAKGKLADARKQAKAHATEWLAAATKEQSTIHNPLATVRRSLAMLDAILMTLPTDLRGKVGGYTQLSKLNSNEKRLEFFEKRLDKLDSVIEKWQKRTLTKQIDKLIKSAKVKKTSKGVPKAKLTAEFTDKVMHIKKLSEMTQDEVDTRKEKIIEEISKTDNQTEIDELVSEEVELIAFGNIDGQNAKSLTSFYENLLSVVKTGKTIKEFKDAEFKEQLDELKEIINKDVTGGGGRMLSSEAKTRKAKMEKLSSLNKFHRKNLSWEWLVNGLARENKEVGTLDSETHHRLSKMVHVATHAEKRMNAGLQKDYSDFLSSVFGVKGLKLTEKISEMMDEVQTNVMRVDYLGKGAHSMKKAKASNIESIIKGQADFEKLGMTQAEYDAARVEYNRIKEAGKGVVDGSRIIRYESPNAGRSDALILSQSQAINLTMMFRQEGIQESMIHEGYTEETMEQMEEFLSPQSVQIRDWLATQYKENHAVVNEVFKEANGVSLPSIENYSPVRRLADGVAKDLEIDSNGGAAMSTNPNFTISRVKNFAEVDQNADALSVYMQHMVQTNHYVTWAKPTKILRSVFSDKTVKKNIQDYAGDSLLSAINERVEWFADGGNKKATHIRWLDSLRAAHTYGSLAFNWQVGIKQLTSIPAFMFDMGFKDFGKYSLEFMKNPIDNIKSMMATDYVKTRFGEGYERDVIDGLNKQGGAILKGLQYGMMFGKVGDIIPVMIGGWMAKKRSYDNAIKAGMSESQAESKSLIDFEMTTDRAQQAGDLKDLSSFQGGGSLFKLFTMYKTSPRQYYANVYESFLDSKAGKKGASKEFARRALIGQIVLPLTFQFASDLLKSPFNGDDEDYDGANYLRAMLMGPLNGLFIAGDFAELAFSGISGADIWAEKVPILDGATKAAYGIHDLWDGDFLEGVDNIARGIGKTTPNVLTYYEVLRKQSDNFFGKIEFD